MEAYINGNVLLVGEGDYSFSCSLHENLDHSCVSSILASSLDTAMTISKHKHATQNMALLAEMGVQIRMDTDATQLHSIPELSSREFHTIVFNFPHAGGKSNHKKNRKLLNDFFASAVQVLHKHGRILVTLCRGQGGSPADRPMRAWHDSWQVVSMAANAGLVLTATIPFVAEKYSCYASTGFRSLDKGFNTEGAITHVFEPAECVSPEPSLGDHVIKVGSTIYRCGPYLYSRLHGIRFINNNADHPIHKLYLTLQDRLRALFQQKFHDFPNTPWLPFRGSLEDEGASGEDRNFDFTDIDDTICSQENVYQTLPLVENPLFYAADGLKCSYGPVFLTCPISTNYLPVQYHMAVSWPSDWMKSAFINDDGEATALKDEFLKKVQDLLCSVCNIDTTFSNEPDRPGQLTENICGDSLEFQWKGKITSKYDDIDTHIGDFYCGTNIGCKPAKHTSTGQEPENKNVRVLTLNLSRLVCRACYITDERLLWSQDRRILTQFQNVDFLENASSMERNSITCNFENTPTPARGIHDGEQCLLRLNDGTGCMVTNSPKIDGNTLVHSPPVGKNTIQTFSMYPMLFRHDMSFWENSTQPFDEQVLFDIVRDIAGDIVVSVDLKETYTGPDERISRCYSLVFQSSDKALSYNTSWKLQSLIRLETQRCLDVILR